MLWLTQFTGFCVNRVARATIAYCDSGAAIADGSGSPITFAAKSLGVPSGDRLIVVAAMFRSGLGANPTVKIAGVVATQVAHTGAGTNNGDQAGIWVAAVPSGTTDDIVIAAMDAFARYAIAIYAVYGASSTTPFATGTDNTSTYSVTLSSCPPGSVAIGAFLNGGATTTLWTGLTENVDTVNNNVNYSAASLQDVSGNLSITATPSSVSDASLACAAWSPG